MAKFFGESRAIRLAQPLLRGPPSAKHRCTGPRWAEPPATAVKVPTPSWCPVATKMTRTLVMSSSRPGHGGSHPATKQQIADQDIDAHGNAGLVRSQLDGLPVRVIRGAHGDPAYSPPTGFRYDGLFQVANHWSKAGKSGYRIWQFHLVRLREGDTTAPPLGVPPPAGTAGAVPRVAAVVQRQVRNSAVVEVVKRLHGYRCQVCGEQLLVPTAPYAEGAHIRPLGRPHHGPDVPENVLCLCPNDHVRFDNGALYLLDDLTVVDGSTGRRLGMLHQQRNHRIDPAYVRYHRELW